MDRPEEDLERQEEKVSGARDGGREGMARRLGAGEARWEAIEFGHKEVAVTVVGDCHQHQQRIGEHLGGEEGETGLDVIKERLLGTQVLLF